MRVRITWHRCRTYDAARKLVGVYLHERGGRPVYWGKAAKTFGERYRLGYKHWIDVCLQNGSWLYVGTLHESALSRLEDVERRLILDCGSEMNKHRLQPKKSVRLGHAGQIPACIRRLLKKGRIG